MTYPNDVIGIAKGNFMNLATAVGIYAAVTKELGRPLVFPGSPAFYTRFDCFTHAPLHARFNIWAALAPASAVGNQAFNVVNGDAESWQNMWPKLAAKFGINVPASMFSADQVDGKFGDDGLVMPLMKRPPFAEFAAGCGLEGSKQVAQSRVEGTIDLVKWSQRSEVKEAWTRLARRHELESGALEGATWGFLNFVLGRNFDLVISMSEARKAGWTGYQDTWTALGESLDGLVGEKILPGF